jgi:hypothetical protein
MNPRRLTVVLTAVLVLLAGGFGEARADLKWTKPSHHAGRVKVAVGGKKSTYYRASKQAPVTLRVQGPVPLRVLHRYFVPSLTSVTPARYSIRITLDGKVLKSDAAKVRLVKDAAIDGGGFAQIPAGVHTVTITPGDNVSTALLRIYTGTARKQKVQWTSFDAHTYKESIRLHNRESETTYFRFDQTAPAGVEVIGPMRMLVGTRIDFGLPDGYTQNYVVKVLKDQKPWKSFALKARGSHTATYPDQSRTIPGVERSFELSIPRGRHDLTFLLEGTTAGGASLRLRVPQRDLIPKKRNASAQGEAP